MIMYSLRRNIVLLLITLAAVTGCSLQPPVPEDHFYRLPALTLKTDNALTNHLSVKRFKTDGLHSERPLLFSEHGKPLSLKQYHYHFWTDAPPRMLQENLISTLRKTGVAAVVSDYDPVRRGGYIISGKIRQFEQVSRGKDNKVSIELELRIDDSHGKILLVKDYQREQSATSARPHDLVTAFGTALAAIYAEFITDWKNVKAN